MSTETDGLERPVTDYAVDVDDDLEDAIRADTDTFLVSTSSHNNTLHYPDPDDGSVPLCYPISTAPKASRFGSDDASGWDPKDTACYPPGWTDICENCAGRWQSVCED